MNNEIDIIECFLDVTSVSHEFDKKIFVWGGYVQDIMEGKILKEHGDIDIFMEDMDLNITPLIATLEKLRFNCKYSSDIQMLNLERDNLKITINPINFSSNTAVWKHIGEQGFFCFPKEWLDKEYRNFYGIKLLTSGYKFEYCIRKLIRYTNPNWQKNTRDKDINAEEYYYKKLLENKIEPEELLEKIWSYNPFWLKDGYNGYEQPVLVLGKEYKKNGETSA